MSMTPIRTYSNWNKRSSNDEKQIEPYRRYYFICEGKNTERWYFEKLIDIRKNLSIHSDIEVAYLEKTGKDENISNPKSLIEFADAQKKNGKIKFDAKHDKMIVVFDADIFESQQSNYEEILELGKKHNILGVTNPSFELFLLLHYSNSAEEIIIPDSENIVKNNWVGKNQNRRRYIEDVFRKKAKMRPKTNSAIGELAYDVFVAIEQEKKINNDIDNCKGIVTSNIGGIIQSIIDDQCNS